ncbi:ABC transporter substrate-binding protein [Brucella pseudogrignonensis]|uniref:ABC transporter substrate-binding protein n=1 Tax=Brucella pseudogrignonensis TaxID=419475 RepID=UPI000CFAE16D|nr:ABC transporter substrate-binding protein [Brucella pseudogrignonensis]MQP42180.1 ABC transporter substrate-binding protein [Ochrobactrum sp. MYb237]PQZ41140.1 ABC transporter substrate-binding protein [Brucella pseudogrignonensis]PRA39559.1 ABC transporter substrate-binding protein [Brucella pseudogrignonensis]PRA65079.1 ABC transporter substrate-binding protein [Brucella pseudogrignonensis]
MSEKITNWTSSDDRMIENAIRRGATRRELLQMMLMGGVAAVAGTTILGRATSAVAATPVKGGFIKAAGFSASTADTLDPAKASNATDYVRCCAFYNRLTFLDGSGQTQMELAESVESADAKVWTVKLRKGVTFHDGKSLTADDVVFSLQRHLDPAVGSKVNALAKQITGVKKIDDTTAEIVLESANADLPTILAMHHFMIVANGTTDFSKGNGTGPFVCKEFQPGVRSIAARNESYWKNSGPHLDSFEFFAISDESARMNAVLSGDIHLGANLNPRSLRVLENNPAAKLFISKLGTYTNLNVRLDMTPGDKAGVAEAFKYLTNREVIQKSVLRGLAEIANDHPVPDTSKYFNAELKQREFDPERAKSLLEKAGVLGQEIHITAAEAASSSLDYAMVLQQAASTIGQKITIDRVPSDGYWSNHWLKDAVHYGNINARPTPDILFSLLYKSDAPWNESQYKSEKFDSMLLEARGLLDEAKRKEIYGQMQAMISNEAGTVIPVFMSNVDAISPKLNGLEPNPLGGMMGYTFAEHAWLEA